MSKLLTPIISLKIYNIFIFLYKWVSKSIQQQKQKQKSNATTNERKKTHTHFSTNLWAKRPQKFTKSIYSSNIILKFNIVCYSE